MGSPFHAFRSPISFIMITLVVIFLGLCLVSPALGMDIRGPQYPLCPLTGKIPVKQAKSGTRCMDAALETCCDTCADLRQALGLVSANFSNFMQWAGLPPSATALLNAATGGQDANMCTIFSKKDPVSGTDGQACSNFLERLMCAMSCHPDGGSFIRRLENGTYIFSLWNATYSKIAEVCGNVSVPGSNGKLSQFFPSGLPLLQSLANVASGLGGLPRFQISVFDIQDETTHATPKCWGDPALIVSPSPACCSTLTLKGCPRGVLKGDLRGRTYLGRFAGDKGAPLTCRQGNEFQGKNITNFSPPPPGPPTLRRESLEGPKQLGLQVHSSLVVL